MKLYLYEGRKDLSRTSKLLWWLKMTPLIIFMLVVMAITIVFCVFVVLGVGNFILNPPDEPINNSQSDPDNDNCVPDPWGAC